MLITPKQYMTLELYIKNKKGLIKPLECYEKGAFALIKIIKQ